MSENKFKDMGYDAVLPMHLVLNTEIEPQAKCLYAVVRRLASINGECYASNKYLANTFDAGERTIREWLASLIEFGYIKINYNHLGNERIIEICHVNKKINTPGEKPPGGVAKNRQGGGEKSPYKEELLNKNIKEDNCSVPSAASDLPKKILKKRTDGKEISIELDDVFRHSILQRKDWKPSHIWKSWEILHKSDVHVNDMMGFIEGTIENLQKKESMSKLRETKKSDNKCNNTQKTGRAPTEEDWKNLGSTKQLWQQLGLTV